MVTRIISTGSKKRQWDPQPGVTMIGEQQREKKRGGAKAAPRSGVKGEATRKYIYIQQVWH